MPIDTLLQEAEGLPDSMIMEIIRFVRFIKIDSGESTKNKSKKELREELFGIYKGKGWMSDDFDEPLEDFKEYME